MDGSGLPQNKTTKKIYFPLAKELSQQFQTFLNNTGNSLLNTIFLQKGV